MLEITKRRLRELGWFAANFWSSNCFTSYQHKLSERPDHEFPSGEVVAKQWWANSKTNRWWCRGRDLNPGPPGIFLGL